MRVQIEVEDLTTLIAAARVLRAALAESGADTTALDKTVENIARVIKEPDASGVFPPGMISDN